MIGVGLPGFSIERDLLVNYFDQNERPGFDYAYRYPGMQRVLQAVGRLIRSEDDQGAALLVDRRFLEPRYENLFPSWWTVIPDEIPNDWDDSKFGSEISKSLSLSFSIHCGQKLRQAALFD